MTSNPAGRKFLREENAWSLIILLGLLTQVLWLSFSPIRDPDTLWHLKAGEIIFNTRAIPHTDPFSYVLDGKPWISFEWLSYVLFHLAYRVGGMTGLLFFKATVLGTAFVLFYRLAGGNAWAGIFLSLVGLLDEGFFTERPHCFDFLLLALTLTFVLKEKDKPKAAWWALPIVHAFWANLHGAAGMLGIAIVALRGAFCRGRASREWFTLAILCAAAMMANPHGGRIFTHFFGLLTFPYRTAFRNWSLVVEWAPLWVNPQQNYLAVVLLAIVSMIFSWRREPFLATLCLLLSIMAISSFRHISILSFVAAILAARTAENRFLNGSGTKISVAALLCMGTLCTAAVLRYSFFQTLGKIPAKEPPEQALRFLDEHSVNGRMFHSPGLAGFIIWRDYPRRKIFVDSRYPEYGADFIQKAFFWNEPDNWRALDSAWRFDSALVENENHYNAKVLDDSPSWALVFWDDTALVYLKRESQNDKLIRRYGYHWLKPNQLDYNYLGPLLQDPKIRPQVMAEIERSIQESDKNNNAYELRAMVLLQMQRYPEAILDLEWVTQRLPTNPGPLMSLGWCYELMRNYEKARDYYVRAAAAAHRQDDVRTEAYLDNNIGAVDFKLGRRDEAEKMFRRCLKLWPSHREARQNLIRIGTVP